MAEADSENKFSIDEVSLGSCSPEKKGNDFGLGQNGDLVPEIPGFLLNIGPISPIMAVACNSGEERQ